MDVLGEEHTYLTELKAPNYIYNYKWIIKNYNVHNKRYQEFMVSPNFQTSGMECYLKLYPHGCQGYSTYVCVSFCIKENKETATKVLVDFSILNDKLEITHTGKGGCSKQHDNCPNICCLEFIKQNALLDATNKLLVDNQLTVVCTVTRLTSIVNAPFYKTIQLEKTNDDFSLSNNLKKSLNNEFMADITLEANGEKLRAHKFILASRSPVFAAMLQNDMKEKENSIIEIEDASADVLSKMLEFLYSDKIENIKDHSEELLYVANKYDIKGLKHLSEQSMISGLSIKNFVHAFMLAETYCCNKLKQEVLKFIINNSFKITNDPQFESWKKNLPEIVVDIIKANA